MKMLEPQSESTPYMTGLLHLYITHASEVLNSTGVI